MPFDGKTIMDRRVEFVVAATQPGANRAALYRHYGIDPKTGRTWIARYQAGGRAALADRSRRPHQSPRQTAPDREAVVVALRIAHPTWGGRKLEARLRAQGMADVPRASTITGILRRHDLLDPALTGPRAWQRFERDTPNALWQMDFKGHHQLQQGRVHPLSVLDDHSRFALGLFACAHERGSLVQQDLITCFQQYGLPEALLADNGGPWGASHPGSLTWLEAWLIRLGIRVIHGRPYHPQTQGKVERWHRTIKADVFQLETFPDVTTTQVALDQFRHCYNTERPHEALGMAVPASRYQPSPRPYPGTLPEIVYGLDDTVCRVHPSGTISFRGTIAYVGEGLRGLPVGVRPTSEDGVFVVRFCKQEIRTIDLRP